MCRMKLLILILVLVKAEDFDEGEIMIAQESRQYETYVKPPVKIIKPRGVTNSHRPQYNLDSVEADDEGMVREAVLRALEKKNHMGKFAQILPIIRAMSGNQRVALASLVASQVMVPGRQLNLAQVRSLFSNDNSTAELMLPILIDTANLIQRALRSGKHPRDIRYTPGNQPKDTHNQDMYQPDKQPRDIRHTPGNQPLNPSRPLFQRRSFTEDDEPFDIGVKDASTQVTDNVPQKFDRIKLPPRTLIKQNNTDANELNKTQDHKPDTEDNRNASRSSTTEANLKSRESTTRIYDNGTFDLMTDATNQTISQDLPVAEKLRSLNRYLDRKGNLIRRGTYQPKPTTVRRIEHTTSSIARRRPIPARKLPALADHAKCELFTNTLCLHSEDYPTDAILQSLRRNKAAGALLADIKEPGEGAVDGITAAQEAKYTADHYLISDRRGDTANRDFASAGEAGFMCPSTVKYARPQRARATSGQWKYIVNTGEHTQTLRLEKCLKPKESCTYLTDNFKSKCVQVYNYHRLLTWDQQNGLHMDIFKVPTCCSCHIEGYSVSFPPVGHRVHETSSEHFPGEDLSPEQGNREFEDVQSTVQRPTLNKLPNFDFNRPVDSFPPYENTLHGSPFSKLNNEEINNIQSAGPTDSYGNSYFPDNFNQASSIGNIKRPVPRNPAGIGNPSSIVALDSVTLPSYLEPPTPSAPSSSFSFSNDAVNKFKLSEQSKRGIRPNRFRKPIRKKISSIPDDLMSSGTSAVGSFQGEDLDSLEDDNDELEEAQISKVVNRVIPRPTIVPKLPSIKEQIYHHDESKIINDANGKKINYNYHPIIDFFEEDTRDNDSIDREDNLDDVSSMESEWKPISHTPIDRRKH